MYKKPVGIVVGVDKTSGNPFRAIFYSEFIQPNNISEMIIGTNTNFDKGISALISKGFVCNQQTIVTTPFEWDFKKYELEGKARALFTQKQEEQAAIKKALEAKQQAIERETGVRNFKLGRKVIALLVALAIGAGGYSWYSKSKHNKATVPPLSRPGINMELPNYLTNEQELALKEQYALGELNFDLTDKEEVERRIGYFGGYFDNMTKHHLTLTEQIDFFLLMNGVEPIFNKDVEDIMIKVQLAASSDSGFNWREKSGEEIIAIKRDSAYLDIYLKVINDWKVAAESKNLETGRVAGKEFVATSIYGIIEKEPLDTGKDGIGAVHMQDVSIEMQAFITGYVGRVTYYPGIDARDTIGKIMIKGEEVDTDYLCEPIAGPYIMPAGEQGRTDQGGEQGLAQTTMMKLVAKYINGSYIKCSSELRQFLEDLAKEYTKQKGGRR